MVGKEILIIGACNVIFIIITIVLIFIDFGNGDFGGQEVIAILSIIWCFINCFLSFYYLNQKSNNYINKKKKKTKYEEKQSLSDDDNNDIRITMISESETKGLTTTTTTKNKNDNKNSIELTSTYKQQMKDIQEKYEKSEENFKKSEYEKHQIEIEKDELEKLYNTYRDETAKDSLDLITKCQNYKQENVVLNDKFIQLNEKYDALNVQLDDLNVENDELKDINNELNDKYKILNDDKLKIEIENNDKIIDINALKDKYDELQSELNAKNANNDIINKQILQYEDTIKDNQNNINLLNKNILNLKQEKNENQLNFEREIEKLTNKLLELKQKQQQQQQQQQKTVIDNVSASNASGDNGSDDTHKQILKLKQDLATAQKTILDMTSVVGVQQSFPTVQETIQQYRSIRDQKHHDTSTILKKFIKNNNNKYAKYFVNQIIHRLMFNILINCYKSMKEYRIYIYDSISDILNINNAIADSNDIDLNDLNTDNSNNIEMINREKYKLLSNIFGSYFKNNFKHVLNKKLNNNNNNISDDDNKDQDNKDNNLVNNILNEMLQSSLYSKYFSDLTDTELICLREYIRECCEVCWIMILQDPALCIKPFKWLYNENDNLKNDKYNENIHKRVLGSDRHSKNILYTVWPAVSRNDIILGDQKIDVVLKNELYTEFKPKRNSIQSVK